MILCLKETYCYYLSLSLTLHAIYILRNLHIPCKISKVDFINLNRLLTNIIEISNLPKHITSLI